MSKTILFLCTGNYYRSRFSEIMFNHLASEEGLNWHAMSAGLKPSPLNPGRISIHTIAGLEERGVPLPPNQPFPRLVTEADLQQADRVVAVKEIEHRPMLEEQHPAWANQVTYWHVHDVDQALPKDALAELEQHVRELIQELKEK